MKNLPENNLMNWLGNRLRQIEQNPDDEVWAKIESTVFKKHTRERHNTRYLMVMALAILFITHGDSSFDGFSYRGNVDELLSYPNKSTGAPTANAIESSPSILNRSAEMRVPEIPTKNFIAHTGFEENIVRDQQQSKDLANDSSHSIGILTKPTEFKKRSEVRSNEFTLSNADTILIDVTPHDSLKQDVPSDQIEPGKKMKWFYFSVTPSMSYYRISPRASDGMILSHVNSPPRLSSDRLGLKVETGIEIPLSRSVSLYSGLSYFHQDYNIQFSSQDQVGGVSASTDELSFQITRPETSHRVEYKVRNIGLQGGLQYELKHGKLNQKVGVGFSWEIGLDKSAGVAQAKNLTNYFFYQVTYRSEYIVTNDVKFFVQPSFSYGFVMDNNPGDSFVMKPHRAGIAVGALLKFPTKEVK